MRKKMEIKKNYWLEGKKEREKQKVAAGHEG